MQKYIMQITQKYISDKIVALKHIRLEAWYCTIIVEEIIGRQNCKY